MITEQSYRKIKVDTRWDKTMELMNKDTATLQALVKDAELMNILKEVKL